MTSQATASATRLSALRLVSFVPAARDAVHVGLLTPDAQHVIDLAPLGVTDALEAIDAIDMLRRAAGAIVHGDARRAIPVQGLHLVAPIPLVRSVVQASALPGRVPQGHPLGTDALRFLDPATLHGPGGHISRIEAESASVGLGTVVGSTLAAGAVISDDELDEALIGSVLMLGCARRGDDGGPECHPVAFGPFVAVPRRRPESLVCSRVAPLAPGAPADRQRVVTAPSDADVVALARRALRSHTLRPGDVLTIFPDVLMTAQDAVAGGSWVRCSAPGLGTLSIAVR